MRGGTWGLGDPSRWVVMGCGLGHPAGLLRAAPPVHGLRGLNLLSRLWAPGGQIRVSLCGGAGAAGQWPGGAQVTVCALPPLRPGPRLHPEPHPQAAALQRAGGQRGGAGRGQCPGLPAQQRCVGWSPGAARLAPAPPAPGLPENAPAYSPWFSLQASPTGT